DDRAHSRCRLASTPKSCPRARRPAPCCCGTRPRLLRCARMSSGAFDDLRISYGDRALTPEDLPAEPIALFRAWLAEATAAGVPEPNGMALATVDETGAPACRIVLLKGL